MLIKIVFNKWAYYKYSINQIENFQKFYIYLNLDEQMDT